jgi:hypothetical protein
VVLTQGTVDVHIHCLLIHNTIVTPDPLAGILGMRMVSTAPKVFTDTTNEFDVESI